jgi:Tol biopolymer transport system component
MIAYWTGVEGERTASSGQVWVAPAAGGTPRRLAAEFVDARAPSWSPDGRWILFRGARDGRPTLDANREWWTMDATGSRLSATGIMAKLRAQGLMPHDSPAAWDASRVVFSARTGHTYNLWSIGINSFFRKGTGSPRPITTSNGFQAVPAILADGRIAYAIWKEQINLWRVSTANGDVHQVTFHDAMDTRVSVARDGKTIAFGRRLGETRDVWVKEMLTGAERVVARNELAVPFISPRGDAVALSIGSSIRLLDVATGKQEQLCGSCGELLGWLPDQSAIIYSQDRTDSTSAVMAFDVASRKSRPLVVGPGVHEAAVSPDGEKIAFTVRRNGVSSQIMMARLSDAGPASDWTPLVSENRWADKPAWSDDSRTVYYRSDRDGFQCIWEQRVDAAGRKTQGEAAVVQHFHKITFTLSHLPPTAIGVAQAGGQVFLSVDADTSNIWSIRP